jgi:glycosyltransferase involved in cell wall biosynthesis
MARVLVAIPNYNNKSFILEAIYSVTKQNIDNLDVVVFDNASTDGVVDLVRSEFGSRVKVFVNSGNVGAVRNHNLCLDYAVTNNYDYVKLLSSDDVLIDGALAKEIGLLEKYPEVSIVNSNMILVDASLNFVKNIHFAGADAPGSPLKGSEFVKTAAKRLENLFGGPSGFLIRVRACGQTKFDTSYRWISDLKFATDLVKDSYFINSGQFGFYYRRHSETDSASLEKRFFIKTLEFFRYSCRYGGGLAGLARSLYNFLRFFKASLT